MSIINFKKILALSNEDRVDWTENLLKSEQYKKWLSSKGTEDRLIRILEFDKPSCISSIDIGNNGSGSIDLFVSLSKSDEWTVLLPSTILMTASESRSNTNRHQIRSFHVNKTCLNKKWQRLKIICEQKLNRADQFGLDFIKLHCKDDHHTETSTVSSDDETEQEQKKIGSFFAKKQLEKKSQLPSNDESPIKDQQTDKSQIMKDIVFVLSGFKNPLRSELRNKATTMGALYSDDWDEKCTHLISAFPNTPKSVQVQQTGKGFIVSKQWILDCYKQTQLLSEKSYELDEAKQETPKRTSETSKRKTEEEEGSVETKDAKRKTPAKRKSTTKSGNKTNKLKMGEIPDFFHDKHFYVSYGDYDDNTLLDITRVILAYDGILERQITADVTYVITNRMWNQDFAKISKSHPEINFVNLDWLQDCHDENQFAPMQSYLVVP